MPPVPAQPQTDPLALIPLREVAKRMNISPRTIKRMLALDEMDKTPSKRFPRPSLNGKTARTMKWSEARFERWFAEREQEI